MTNYEAAKRLVMLYADHLHMYDTDIDDPDSMIDVVVKAIFSLAGDEVNADS